MFNNFVFILTTEASSPAADFLCGKPVVTSTT